MALNLNRPPSADDTPPRPTTAVPGPARPPVSPPGRPGSSRSLLYAGVAVGALVVIVVVAGLVRAFRSEPKPEPGPVLATPAPAAAPSSGRVAGVSDTEVVFGMSSPFSGAIKELGRGMRTGLEVAFAIANESGGVHGRKLRLTALDDGYDPERTKSVMLELLEQRKVFAIVGNVGSPTAAITIPMVMGKKVVFFGALSGAPLLRKNPPDRYVFNYRPSYAEETAAAVRYLVDVRRIDPRQIGVFYQSDAFGEAGLTGVEEQLRRYRRNPAEMVRATYQRNSADVSEAIARFRKEQGKVKAVVMVATYQAAIQFVQQAKDRGLGLLFTNVSAVGSNELAEGLTSAGAGYTSDVVVTQIVPLPTSKATAALRYQAALDKHAVGEKPGFITFEGYIVGNILIEALRRAGKDLDAEGLVAAFEDIRGLDLGVGTPITFGPKEHQGSHKVWGTQLQPDGSYKSIDLE
ncbi:MAG TPA: ABC transporter substrate-binding protein [Anaeromyxobacteraceae bacterium]|nr:ABC transporter substrate-binding protein [Anaeromyxobacteraceae bacterium]